MTRCTASSSERRRRRRCAPRSIKEILLTGSVIAIGLEHFKLSWACFNVLDALYRTYQIEAQLSTRTAHPADAACGIADHQRIGRYVRDNDRTGADKAIASEGMTAHDRRISADGCATLEERFPELG